VLRVSAVSLFEPLIQPRDTEDAGDYAEKRLKLVPTEMPDVVWVVVAI